MAKEAADAVRLFGLANGSVRASANVAAAEVSIEGKSTEILQSVSGQAIRKGAVPEIGAEGNPQRLFAFNTGNNIRDFDTEIKILNYVANELGEASPEVRGTINLHTENPVCISCRSAIYQFKKQFPNVNVNVTEGK
ncbi:deaminase domain-containing protein [Amycolatopsis carbonis]|uniref:Deaminase domain-containing protein n=1 Tax=Amycolatopsis carbonis TaxID=715471 RepID=A0A9Y2ID79_9PSEU|nr:deaminase domain-containing protein [Amycolatopsis sp. 2-15]WIX76950.1 deaminase domain-containing protein [Amycolatopsis sp. 2-15]